MALFYGAGSMAGTVVNESASQAASPKKPAANPAAPAHKAADRAVLQPTLPLLIGGADAELVLDVLIANDDDFTAIDVAHARVILNEARLTLGQKLGFSHLAFRLVSVQSVQEFFGRLQPSTQSCLDRFESVRTRAGGQKASAVSRKDVLGFLARWPLGELREFFKAPDRPKLTSHEDIANTLMAEFDRKVAMIAGFKLGNGKSLLAAEMADYRSYIHWICAMRVQNEADLVLTNTFILYDLASEPYPHSIFGKGKVGGASLASPNRRGMRGRAMVASTFSMVTDIPYFFEEGAEGLSDVERFQVIGTFIVAHEMGHALFKMPDFYDHPPECLMTTKYETGYVSGFRELKEKPGACPKCTPYVEARRQLFAADAARSRQAWPAAVTALKKAKKDTPKHIDGSYERYMADLSVELGELYLQKGDVREAARWVVDALKQFPGHADAVDLRQRLLEKHRKSSENKGK